MPVHATYGTPGLPELQVVRPEDAIRGLQRIASRILWRNDHLKPPPLILHP